MISLTNFAGASKDDKLKFAFMIFDEDGNGVITKQEVYNSIMFLRELFSLILSGYKSANPQRWVPTL